MSSSNSFHARQLVLWLENVIPAPSLVPDEMKSVYGENPMTHLCPLIADYMGPNPYYFIPDTENFQFKESIKMATAERDTACDVYDPVYHEMQSTSQSIIPTCFYQYDNILKPSLAASLGENTTLEHPHQAYLRSLFNTHHRFAGSYIQRYLPAISHNEMQTYSITDISILSDGSLLVFNERNIYIWPAKYLPPSSDNPLQPVSTPSLHTPAIPLATKTDLDKNPQLGDLSGLSFESACKLHFAKYPPTPPTPSPQLRKIQLDTNSSMSEYILSHLQSLNNVYKRNKVARLFPHLQTSPFLFNSFDLLNNIFNSDIELHTLPHQQSRKLRKAMIGGDLNDVNEDDDDSDFGDENDYDDSEDDSDEDEDEDEDSSSGDNDSEESTSESDSQNGKGKRRLKPHPHCPFGHSIYTASCPVEPLYHISPEQDSLLKNFGISMHSSRLFVTGCQHGHITLHDGWTGYSKFIGRSRYAITHIAIVHTHQHYSELSSAELQNVLNNANNHQLATKLTDPNAYSTLSQPSTATPTNPSNPAPTAASINSTLNSTNSSQHSTSTEVIYHPLTKVFPILVTVDQTGIVMYWDMITSQLISCYGQENQSDDSNDSQQNQRQNEKTVYNNTGFLRMPLCVVPLLPQVQRSVRFGNPLMPSQSIYAASHSSVLAMVFSKYQECGINLNTGLPNNMQPLVHTMTQGKGAQVTRKIDINPPRYSTQPQPWSPYNGFPFHIAHPKLNDGLLCQFTKPDEPHYTVPHAAYSQPGSQSLPSISPSDLATPLRSTYAAPTLIITPFRGGQLTFGDLRLVNSPSYYTFGHKQHVTSIAYIGGLIWTAGWDCVVKSWDPRFLAVPVHTIECAKKHITAIAGLDDKYLIVATAEKELKVFDIERLGINKTYMLQAIQSCEEYIRSVDFGDFAEALEEHKKKQIQRQQATQAPEADLQTDHGSSASGRDLTSPMNESTHPFKIDPFATSKYTMLSLYPNMTHTQIFQQWLLSKHLTYLNGRFYPLMTSYDPATNSIQSNMLTVQNNGNRYVPVTRNPQTRLEAATDACIFDWDIEELIQNIVTVNGVILTTSKECKSKVGLNRFLGNITPWITSIDVGEELFPQQE